jgi:hypothetical protein
MRLCNISFLSLIPSPKRMEGKKGRLLIVDDELDITNSFSLALLLAFDYSSPFSTSSGETSSFTPFSSSSVLPVGEFSLLSIPL